MKANRILYVVLAVALLTAGVFVVQAAMETSALERSPEAAQADIDRWVAMGDYYTQAQTASNIGSSDQAARAADVARWVAMGEAYNQPNTAAREADVARWVAMGEAYNQSNTAAREADVARWVALGDYYGKQIPVTGNVITPNAILTSANYTGLALAEYERSGNPAVLPQCLSSEILAQLPARFGSDAWKKLVPACGR